MRIPKYWARQTCRGEDPKGRSIVLQTRGWSDASLAAAREKAAQRAQNALARLFREEPLGDYEYLDQPIPEEIVDSVGPQGQEIAVITRNRYGSLVLNSASVCFVDIDFPPIQSQGIKDALALLFSKRKRNERKQALEQTTLQNVRSWAQRNSSRLFRLYRTAAGLRLLFTDRLYDPTSRETSSLLQELGSDRLYRRLTEKQECFRARLTPKPWRIGCTRPPTGFPWIDDSAEQEYRQWQRTYEQKSTPYQVCQLVESVGQDASDNTITAIVALHDRYTCTNGAAELA